MREHVVLYGMTAVPTMIPLLPLLAPALWRSIPLTVIRIGYLGVNYLLFLWMNRRYLGGVSPLRWSWLVPLVQLLLPLQLLIALLQPQQINWHGHIMQVERGGGFRFVQRRE